MARRPVPCSSCSRPCQIGRGSLATPTCNECRTKDLMKTCESCGIEFTAKTRKQKYCSPGCVYGHRTVELTCEICDRLFVDTYGTGATTCSALCGLMKWRRGLVLQ